MDLIKRPIPTKKQTVINVFLISLFPFKLNKWAPKYPPVKEPNINIINIIGEIDPTLLKKIAPVRFQKIPTVKKVKLTARRKSIPNDLIKSIVTSNPVPEEIEPFKIPIRKIKIKNLILLDKLMLIFPDDIPNSDLRNV